MEKIKINHMVEQDGRDFYDFDGGLHLYQSTIKVGMDLQKAIEARKEFIEWCKQRNLIVAFK